MEGGRTEGGRKEGGRECVLGLQYLFFSHPSVFHVLLYLLSTSVDDWTMAGI